MCLSMDTYTNTYTQFNITVLFYEIVITSFGKEFFYEGSERQGSYQRPYWWWPDRVLPTGGRIARAVWAHVLHCPAHVRALPTAPQIDSPSATVGKQLAPLLYTVWGFFLCWTKTFPSTTSTHWSLYPGWTVPCTHSCQHIWKPQKYPVRLYYCQMSSLFHISHTTGFTEHSLFSLSFSEEPWSSHLPAWWGTSAGISAPGGI